jgi:hypothetical protein
MRLNVGHRGLGTGGLSSTVEAVEHDYDKIAVGHGLAGLPRYGRALPFKIVLLVIRPDMSDDVAADSSVSVLQPLQPSRQGLHVQGPLFLALFFSDPSGLDQRHGPLDCVSRILSADELNIAPLGPNVGHLGRDLLLGVIPSDRPLPAPTARPSRRPVLHVLRPRVSSPRTRS